MSLCIDPIGKQQPKGVLLNESKQDKGKWESGFPKHIIAQNLNVHWPRIDFIRLLFANHDNIATAHLD